MLSLLVLLACPRPTPTTGPPASSPSASAPSPPATARAPAAAPPSAPPRLPAVVPPPSAPPAPALEGKINAVELAGTSKSRVIFTLGGDLSPLERIDAAELPTLTEHLAANPRWRLTRWEGALVAFRRVEDSRLGRTLGWAGYHSTDDATWRSLLRLSARDPASEWSRSPLVGRFRPTDSSLKLQAWQPPGEGRYDWRAAALEANGPVVSLEIHEEARNLELTRTAEALREAMRALLNFDQFKEEGDAAQAPWGWLPPGEPSPDPAGLWLTPLSGQGLDLRGRLNPGGAGWTWARITDGQGRPWQEELVAAATLERIGWSASPAQTFWFQGRIPTEEPLPAGAVVEAWHQAEGDTEPRRIGRWSAAPRSP